MSTTWRPVHLDQRVDRVAGGAGQVVHHHPVLAEDRVQDRALADVRAGRGCRSPARARARAVRRPGRLRQRAPRARPAGRRCPRPCCAETAWTSPMPDATGGSGRRPPGRQSSLLLATSMIGRPVRRRRSATSRSPAVGRRLRRRRRRAIRSASSIPRTAWAATWRPTSLGSASSMPPVSMSWKARPFHSAPAWRRSRVTPATASTTASRRPARRLKSVDLPTFG